MNLQYIDRLDSLRLHINGLYERFETRLVEKKLKSGQVFIDVGAHIGYYTVLAAQIVGIKGKIYAFEPEPENFNLLNSNVKANGFSNVQIFKKAVSDFNGKALLYLSDKNSGDHQLFKTNGRNSIEVDVVSLDEFLLPINIMKVDFIKIDVQGVECAVLQGAKNLIRQSPNIKILIEYAPAHLRLAGSDPKEMICLLRNMGFDIYTQNKNILAPVPREIMNPNRKKSHINLYCERRKDS